MGLAPFCVAVPGRDGVLRVARAVVEDVFIAPFNSKQRARLERQQQTSGFLGKTRWKSAETFGIRGYSRRPKAQTEMSSLR
jgi:hypothetical protein